MKGLHKTPEQSRETEIDGAVWRLLSLGKGLSIGQLSARLPFVNFHELNSSLRRLLHVGSIGVVDRCFYLRRVNAG